MRTPEPTDDRNIQAVMVATYYALWKQSTDKGSMPPLSQLKKDVNTFLQNLSVEPHIQPEAMFKRYELFDFAKAIIDFVFKPKPRKPLRLK